LSVDKSTSGRFNDLWMFDGEEWVWTSGAKSKDNKGVYGEEGVPHPDNIPSARSGAVSWMDNSGNMWLFGGKQFAGDSIHVNYK
jgi:hypothetical protein